MNTYGYVGENSLRLVDPYGLVDIFIGGLGDSFTDIVGNYQEDFARDFPTRDSHYFGWNNSTGIIKTINSIRRDKPCGPINLIGHSFGGNTAVDIAAALGAKGVLVDTLITIDPVSFPWSRSSVGANVGQWININAAPDSTDYSDLVASIGRKWANGYPAPFHHNEFSSMINWKPAGGQSPINRLLNSDNSGWY